MKKIFQFFKECAGELRKVTWPTRSDVLYNYCRIDSWLS